MPHYQHYSFDVFELENAPRSESRSPTNIQRYIKVINSRKQGQKDLHITHSAYRENEERGRLLKKAYI